MKRLFAVALISAAAGTAAWAQVSNPSIVLVVSAPSGSCTQNLPDQQVVSLGTIYTCQSGTWAQVGGSVSSVTATSPLTSSGGATPNLSLHVADASVNGYLASTDWSTFNGKQAALSLVAGTMSLSSLSAKSM